MHRTFRNLSIMAFGLALASCASHDQESEARAERTGTLVLTLGRTSDQKNFQQYYLSEHGKKTPLTVKKPIKAKPNSRVRVIGSVAKDGRTIVADDILPDFKVGLAEQSLSETAPEGSIAVFLIKNTGAADPYSADAVRATLLDNSDSTAAFFGEVSRNNFNISADVFGWYEYDIASDCSVAWSALDSAMAAAENDGYDTNQYRHALAVFGIPAGGVDCGIAWGTLGRPEGTGTVVSYWNNSNSFAHELGHNIGLHHAGSMTCRDTSLNLVPFSASCNYESYNDPFDGMGYQGHYYHFNSYSKSLLDWLPANGQATVTSSGDYHLTAHEQAASGLQSLYVPITGTSDALHVEVREQFGFDSEARFNNARSRAPGQSIWVPAGDLPGGHESGRQ